MSDTSDTDLNAADLVDYEVGITVDRSTNPMQYIGRRPQASGNRA